MPIQYIRQQHIHQIGQAKFIRITDDRTVRDLHISRRAREKYEFDLSMFSVRGNVIFANLYAARMFSERINKKRDLIHNPGAAVNAADLNAMGLMHEIMHILVARYKQIHNANLFKDSQNHLNENFGPVAVSKTLHAFTEAFPPLPVFTGKMTTEEYLRGQTGGISNSGIMLEEMLLLWLTNDNPAFNPLRELHDDSSLRETSSYSEMINALQEFLDTQPALLPASGKGPGVTLFKLLRQPALNSPNSIADQLRHLSEYWGDYIDTTILAKQDEYLGEAFQEKWGDLPQYSETRLLRTLDFITEEQKVRFNPGLGPAPTHVPEYYESDVEYEQFSEDLHWMPQLVIIAKSTLVWLDQLSRQYEREILRLDQIPDTELDILAERGFTGLWLIGIWERSNASEKIKNWCGNPDAAPSAYSLFDYTIASGLGGDNGYENLRDRLWQRGIRLASDMVPNHTGIDSSWIREHPDWFIQLPYSPYPSYRFSGQSLSEDANIGVYLEDHYFDRTDAAVVFKHVDHRTGRERYIYHGNDGTSFPWNDTAQLDFTLPQVREAVIRTIIEVAKKFSVIRFDAAMVLAKKHFHRLWFPEPGGGGDIPSRSEFGLTRPQFDALFPQEFWREVVDRVAVEAPDTLLLAEAFWMMEGYFVRTLGMHRVYNSAFMHMLHNEENKKYRYTIKNTIEFDPEILKRYVNFMNNPDEETAIRQFGDGDKYFGICMMMATMPGLPMFGHGQIEGFEEKYGMEYRKAYMDEQPKQYLIDRHAREIFPLLRKRYLFAEVTNFLLYDMFAENGMVDENVFAYSNSYGAERALVVYNNAYNVTRGWIRISAAYVEKGNDNQQRRLVQKTIGEGLTLSTEGNKYVIYRDAFSNLEYIHHCRTLWDRGLQIELGAYRHHVFMNFREINDDAAGNYRELCNYLHGRGVPSVDEAIQDVHLRPIHSSLQDLLNAGVIKDLVSRMGADNSKKPEKLVTDLRQRYERFLEAIKAHADLEGSATGISAGWAERLQRLISVKPERIVSRLFAKAPAAALRKKIEERFSDKSDRMAILLAWMLSSGTGELRYRKGAMAAGGPISRAAAGFDEWRLGKIVLTELENFGFTQAEAERAVQAVRFMTRFRDWNTAKIAGRNRKKALLEKLFGEAEFQQFVQANEYDDVLWFNKERFENVIEWSFDIVLLMALTDVPPAGKTSATRAAAVTAKKAVPANLYAAGKEIAAAWRLIESWKKAAEKSEFKVSLLLAALSPKPPAKKGVKKKTARKP